MEQESEDADGRVSAEAEQGKGSAESLDERIARLERALKSGGKHEGPSGNVEDFGHNTDDQESAAAEWENFVQDLGFDGESEIIRGRRALTFGNRHLRRGARVRRI
jgi:hypothetical protein